ncbi:MAG: 5,10-methenyltetrahydrofolate synthetase [Thaumarchaeota archaeon]|nr:5,10-methenyltetrahydrofolate synthetase [Nitrososphaerota archaeon]|tara:strand:- start:5529 stop:6296 length:768 start_codon:yes stop_codon:yes gene_type:complete
MNISYEMNPPKIKRNTTFDLDLLKQDMDKFYERISQLVALTDSIHLTDSVFGIPRISSISAAHEIINIHSGIKLRCSVRARDKNLNAIIQLVSDAIMMGVEGLLIIKGDKPENPSIDSGLLSSDIVKTLNEQGFGDKIKLFLSLPNNPDLNQIQKKMEAGPFGFITQLISSLHHLQKIVDHVKSNNRRVIPMIMVPSPKNKESATLIGLDWREYENDTYLFIKQALAMCGEVLITSPNSFNGGMNLLNKIRVEIN